MKPPVKVRDLDSLPEMVTVSEAAAILRCGESTVRMMIRTKRLEAEPVGRLIRIRRMSLERIVRGERERPALRAVK